MESESVSDWRASDHPLLFVLCEGWHIQWLLSVRAAILTWTLSIWRLGFLRFPEQLLKLECGSCLRSYLVGSHVCLPHVLVIKFRVLLLLTGLLSLIGIDLLLRSLANLLQLRLNTPLPLPRNISVLLRINFPSSLVFPTTFALRNSLILFDLILK